MDAMEKRYLELLSKSYPTAASVQAELINLCALMNGPKETEFFMSDIHGEYGAFSHILRNGAGSIREAIDSLFGEGMEPEEKAALATLVYYPEEKLELAAVQVEDLEEWYADVTISLVDLASFLMNRRSVANVRAYLDGEFADIIEQMLNGDVMRVISLVETAVGVGAAPAIITALAKLIQRFSIDRLHMVGDVYDRGPNPHLIMEELMRFHNVDIQWGNHDIVWMGAALGQRGCIAHVVRNCARYGNLDILEDAYGINLRPLVSFALDAYKNDPCVAFNLKGNPGLTPEELEANIKVQKAMAILQFKVEAQLIDENPSFGLEDRKLLDKIDPERGTVVVDGVEYELTDRVFPTVDWADPYRLTDAEEAVMQALEQAFVSCEKLQRHMAFFLEVGSMYKISNGTLMFHACVPLNEDGSLKEVNVNGNIYKGRALYDAMNEYVQDAFFSEDPEAKKLGMDMIWYMWLGEGSPQFAKSKMATFELYLIAEKEARKEVKNAFYSLRDDEAAMGGIFEDFGMDPATSRIVCGHVPVKVKDGEDPVKCGGRVLSIDGGFSAAYQKTTGIAGFTLVSDVQGLVLDANQPLPARQQVVAEDLDIFAERRVVAPAEEGYHLFAHTDQGEEVMQRIADLEALMVAYTTGEIAQK